MGWFGDVFPTKLSFVVFISYMALFINQAILVTASKTSSNTYKYNTVTVVLLTECVKLVTSLILYLKDHSCATLKADIIKYRQVLGLYFVPAFLYCLYNNLQFVNLAAYDPTTYYLLLQFRVVITGVFFQILFRKQLSRIQWASLILLTCGCIIKELNHHGSGTKTGSTESPSTVGTSFLNFDKLLDIHLLFIMLQVFCSVFAGVYNEYLLKDKGCDVHLMMQNIFMYVDSIICNIFVLGFHGDLASVFSVADVMAIFSRPGVIAIVFNAAACGIVTSLFLRSLNCILKTFASALEIMFTAILCWFIFNIPVDAYTVAAIFVVSAAIYLYAQNPIVNKAKNEVTEEPSKTEKSRETV
ncbi:UDP-galactose transporter senju-like [Haliotis rufescens]|uniref:UDP-galactose transporter senju-like n=1 Tax=Haliotis rufescens TaxID=6454 RepID=UPI00201EFF4E|nr:UDP-galactose transporter senju-like [Haliotis rufescens]